MALIDWGEQQGDDVGLMTGGTVLVSWGEQEAQVIMIKTRPMRSTGRRENIAFPIASSPLSKL